MPRQARLDAPGTLHHVIIRGIDRGAIVQDDADRQDFVDRLGRTAVATGTAVYAWALLPNHAHLLLRSGPRGLPSFMRRLLTGYAVVYNRRHRRPGHLFQNRYKSIVCQEEVYFLELVRYIHLNPLRARLVADLHGLDRYPWSGHAAILGRFPHPWLDRGSVLGRFGRTRQTATQAYRSYVREGIPLGRRPELVGGGPARSAGDWAEVRALQRHHEPTPDDPRILGSGDFASALLRQADPQRAAVLRRAPTPQEIERMIAERCRGASLSPRELRQGGRRGPVSLLRASIARELVTEQGLSLARVARHLGVSTSAVSKMLRQREG